MKYFTKPETVIINDIKGVFTIINRKSWFNLLMIELSPLAKLRQFRSKFKTVNDIVQNSDILT